MSFDMQELHLIFGEKKIPELAKGMGQVVREFMKSIKETKKEVETIKE